MKVGVFDSGVGGLTVLKELLKELNSAEFIMVIVLTLHMELKQLRIFKSFVIKSVSF